MSFILGLTIAIALMTGRHALTWTVVMMIGGISIYMLLQKQYWRQRGVIIQRILGMLCGLVAVIIYDTRILGWQWMRESYQWRDLSIAQNKEAIFVIADRERADRYLIEAITGSKQWQQFLQIAQDIPIGSVVSIPPDSYARQRRYRPRLCLSLQCPSESPDDKAIVIQNDQDNNTADPRGRHIFHYDKWLWMRSIEKVSYPAMISIQDDISHITRLDRVRQKFLQTIQQYYGQDVIAWLVAGMTIGDTSMMSKERQQQFINSSLIHIVAVSGGNIAIVLMILWLLLRRMPFYLRQAILIGGVVMYAVFVGDDSSIIRATTMAVLTLLAISSGRLVSIWRLLAYARTGMLLRNPYILMHDLGFVLSFCAVAGILWAEDTMKIMKKEKTATVHTNTKKRIADRLHRVWSIILVTSIVPSIGAAIGVTPILLWSTGTINLVGVVANIVIAAMIPPLTIGWLIVGALGSIWWLSRPIALIALLVKWCVIILLWISTITTQYGIYITRSWPGQILILWIGIALWWWYGWESSKEKKIRERRKEEKGETMP